VTKEKNLLQQLYQHNSELLARIVAFNLAPDSYTHASWLEALDPSVELTKICAGNRSHPLSALLRRQLGLLDDGDWNFSDMGKRLILLPGAILQDLLLYCGISVCWKSILSSVDGRFIGGLKKQYGEEKCLFAIKSAPLLAGSLTLEKQLVDLAELIAAIESQGAKILANSIGELPSEAMKRVQLKFPKSEAFALEQADASQAQRSFALCKRLLFHHTGTQWAFLFN